MKNLWSTIIGNLIIFGFQVWTVIIVVRAYLNEDLLRVTFFGIILVILFIEVIKPTTEGE